MRPTPPTPKPLLEDAPPALQPDELEACVDEAAVEPVVEPPPWPVADVDALAVSPAPWPSPPSPSNSVPVAHAATTRARNKSNRSPRIRHAIRPAVQRKSARSFIHHEGASLEGPVGSRPSMSSDCA